ncbi:alpha/beta hydrolase [Halorhodospira halochloris]|uniref:alpha/beta hydrolase n=1 Tax=Halorhodospira halochloris TaxID=1052 RepID=UPI001EE7859D|nr:alpha/beta hydrolase [Halorhodospira halochloris]MCG5549150.1 alpha/beta hydrolase [Halorhodospira halochloris]
MAFAAMLYTMQERMVHLPQIPGRELVATPDKLGLEWQELTITTEDNVDLHGWHVKSPQARGTLLFFHGNAGNISHRLDSIEIFSELGLDVIIFDYRGYGQSEGRAHEQGLRRDARAAAEWLEENRDGLAGPKTVYFGRSLGGPLAAEAAAHRQPSALILESTFTSAEDVAGDIYPFFPTRLLTRLEYPTAKYLRQTDQPVLVVHSPEDEIIPFQHSQQLLEIAGDRGQMLQIRGDHNTGFRVSGDTYISGLRDFIRSIGED